MASGHPHQHRAGPRARGRPGIAGHHRQGARRRDPQSAHHLPAARLSRIVEAARRGRPPSANKESGRRLQMPVVTAAIRQLLLAEQDPRVRRPAGRPRRRTDGRCIPAPAATCPEAALRRPRHRPRFQAQTGRQAPQLLRQRGVAPDESGVIQRRW